MIGITTHTCGSPLPRPMRPLCKHKQTSALRHTQGGPAGRPERQRGDGITSSFSSSWISSSLVWERGSRSLSCRRAKCNKRWFQFCWFSTYDHHRLEVHTCTWVKLFYRYLYISLHIYIWNSPKKPLLFVRQWSDLAVGVLPDLTISNFEHQNWN